jgi:hypothetical protein
VTKKKKKKKKKKKLTVKGTTTQIVDQDVLLLGFLVQTISDGRSGGFVDNTEHIQTCDGASVLGGLTLSIVEVGGNGDNSILNCKDT